MEEELASLHTAIGADLDQPTGTARVVPRLAITETGFVEMQDGNRKRLGSQESITWKKSRSSSTKSISSPVIAR